MSEPTKEAIAEARSTIAQIGWLLIAPHGSIELNIEDIVELIAHVRKQARDDAAQSCHEIMMQQRAQAGDCDEWEHGKADGAELCRDALKTKGDAHAS